MNDPRSRECPSGKGRTDFGARRALKFIRLIGTLSFFADFTYEGSRSIPGLFTAGYGVFWFLGSAAIGVAYDYSAYAAVAFCVLAELAAVPVFVWVGRRYRPYRSA